MRRLFCPFLYLLWVHLLALLFMSVFRAVFFCTAHAQLPPAAAWHWGSIGRAFLNGLWFDNVIACYLSALPLLAVGIASVGGWWRKGGYRACNVWFGVTYALVFMACAANVPYYAYFGKLLNASIWNWAEYGTQTLGMVFGEPAWYGYIALYFVAVGAFVVLLFRLSRWAIRRETAVSRAQQKLPARVRLLAASATVVLLAGCLLGMLVGARVMVLGVVLGAFVGQMAYSRTPEGKWLKFPTSTFIQYFCAKSLPAIVAVSMLGIAVEGFIF